MSHNGEELYMSDIDDEISVQSSPTKNQVRSPGNEVGGPGGVEASDGTFIRSNAFGHVDLDEVHAHQKTLHTAAYANENEMYTSEEEYKVEFADKQDHRPFTHPEHGHHRIVDFAGLGDDLQEDRDHFDFHHEHGENVTRDTASQLLLRGIDVAQRQNDRGLVMLYRGQKMFMDGDFQNAAINLEKSLDFYRHLNLSDVGSEDENASRSSLGSASKSNDKRRGKIQEEEYENDSHANETNSLDFCPHIYSILVECYFNLGWYQRSNSVAREWLQKYSKNISPYNALAWCLMEQNQTDDAISVCTNCIKKLPETEGMMSIYNIRGKCYMKKEQFEEAVADFKYVKIMGEKNLARFAPEKPVFMKIDKCTQPSFPFFAPKSRPDITMRRNRFQNMGNFMLSPMPSRPTSPERSVSSLAAETGIDVKKQAFITTLDVRPAEWKNRRINVEKVRNYEVLGNTGRHCSKCSPNRDPVTKRSITQLRMGLTVDERVGASPGRLFTAKGLGHYY